MLGNKKISSTLVVCRWAEALKSLAVVNPPPHPPHLRLLLDAIFKSSLIWNSLVKHFERIPTFCGKKGKKEEDSTGLGGLQFAL